MTMGPTSPHLFMNHDGLVDTHFCNISVMMNIVHICVYLILLSKDLQLSKNERKQTQSRGWTRCGMKDKCETCGERGGRVYCKAI